MNTRRLLLAVIASLTALSLVPGVSLARRHHRHHHHALVRHVRFGSDPASPTASPTTTATVVSFTGGVLTIQPSSGSPVSGMVTGDTEIECSSSTTTMTKDDEGPSSGADTSSGDTSGDTGDDAGEDAGDTEDEAPCTSAALTPGAHVQEAELTITGSGAVWNKVVLGS